MSATSPYSTENHKPRVRHRGRSRESVSYQIRNIKHESSGESIRPPALSSDEDVNEAVGNFVRRESDSSSTRGYGQCQSLEEYDYRQIVKNFDIFVPYSSVKVRWVYWEAHIVVMRDRISALRIDQRLLCAKQDKIVGNELDTYLERLRGSEYDSRSADDQGLRIRLLMSVSKRRASDKDEKLLPLPCSQEPFETISKRFLIPLSYVDTLHQGATVIMEFPHCYSKNEDASALIFHNTRLRFRNFGAVVSQHPIQDGKVISAFIHGLVPDEINSLLDRLCALPQLCESHSFIPSILLDFRLNIVTQNSTLALEKVQDIERETGLDPQWNFNPRETPSRDINLLQLNYDQITLNLTALSARLSHYVFICNVHLEMPALLDKTNAQTIAAASSPEHRESLKRCELQLRMRNAQSRAYLKGTQAKVEQLLIRVQAQRDTLFSFVAQRDSRLNQKTADRSADIAEAAVRDGQAMKLLAQAATRDSAAMRYIAIITILFPPATFLATFFSTAFFSFPPSSSSPPKVTIWIWVYFVITVVMTLVVHLGLWCKSKGQEKQIESWLNDIYGSCEKL